MEKKLSSCFFFFRVILCNSHVRKGREGRVESLSHRPRWSFQKRYTLVAQPLRLNMLPRNFCATYRFWKRNRTVFTPLRVWQERSPALTSLPPPQCSPIKNRYASRAATATSAFCPAAASDAISCARKTQEAWGTSRPPRAGTDQPSR